MPLQQKITAIIISITMLLFILNAVRTRKLKEEFSFFWLFIGLIIFCISFWHNLLNYISQLLGIVVPTSTLFLFGLIMIILISIQLSIKISSLMEYNKNLAQKVSILEYELKSLKEKREA